MIFKFTYFSKIFIYILSFIKEILIFILLLIVDSVIKKLIIFIQILKFDFFYQVESLQHFPFVVLSSKIVDGKVTTEIMLTRDNNTSFKADLTQWQPPPEQIGVTMPKLKTNTEVLFYFLKKINLLISLFLNIFLLLYFR